ncbi:hypothetical protein T11_11406 [Trichinella zimbabwensis]|uniref:Uncharacterized protein n=1 Tax=Trichinella zimbabwensis TaxID=268475 RepID=A0A0V1H119_9BILA|nr:hypothetical protein T11_11406 [Trichinella zimbabwensis]
MKVVQCSSSLSTCQSVTFAVDDVALELQMQKPPQRQAGWSKSFAGCQESTVINRHKHEDVLGYTLVQQKVFSRLCFLKFNGNLLVMTVFRKPEEALCLVYVHCGPQTLKYPELT